MRLGRRMAGVVAGLGLALLAVLPAGVARANGPEIGFSVGGVVPLASTRVQLVSEFVRVPVEGGRVSCHYTLRNLSGEPVTITMGFITNNPWPDDPGRYTPYFRETGFAVRARQPLTWRLAGVDPARWAPFLRQAPDSLPVWEVSFGPHEEMPLHVSYQATPDGGCDGSHCGSSMTYFAKSAQAWAGPVEYAEVRFEFGAMARLYRAAAGATPPPYRLRTSPTASREHSWGIVWEYRDWEPDTDFTVSFDWSEPD